MNTNKSVDQPNIEVSKAHAYHTPVLMKEVLEGLHIVPGQWYIDGTIGGGGHAEAILKAGGKVLGLDQDQEAVTQSLSRLSRVEGRGKWEESEFKIVKANFRDMAEVADKCGIDMVAGILLDLGVSSHQLDADYRGFGFKSDTLDMRMDTNQPITAGDLLDRLTEPDLATIFSDLGEERFAKSFARAIKRHLQSETITSGGQLAAVIEKVSPPAYRYGKIHPATRIFQALRLAVNDELGSLRSVLPQVCDLLQPGGRLVVISFHSLEDRIVKQFAVQSADMKVITKSPLMATEEELIVNPRSRSAKLRVVEKI